MDLPQIRKDLASLRQRIRRVFGERVTMLRIAANLGEIGGIIEQSLTASDHLLAYAEGLESRLTKLEQKK